jgi:hypothetical protein
MVNSKNMENKKKKLKKLILHRLSVFGSVVMVIFQSVFHLEIYQNNILLLFFKKHF